ncbi:hypothetical protein DYB32_006532, partial [Aphanomyces invadans]
MDVNAFIDDIVQVPHRAPLPKSTEANVQASVAAFMAFCKQSSADDQAALAPPLKALTTLPCRWLPAYGCAVFVIPAGYNELSHVVLLYPATWQSNLSCRSFGNTMVVLPTSTTVLDLGTIPTDSVDLFKQKLDELLTKDAALHRTSRHAHDGDWRKTPFLVQALAHQALATDGAAASTKHAMMGIHIGTLPRTTAHPLVEAALLYFLGDSRTFTRLRIHFLLWLANNFDVTTDINAIDCIMNLVDAIALGAIDMDDHGASVAEITTQLQTVRANLDATYVRTKDTQAKQLEMTPTKPTDVAVPGMATDVLDPKVSPSKPMTTQERRARALAYCGSLPTYSCHDKVTSASFEQMQTWINSHPRLKAGHDPDACLLVLYEVHTLMWSCAKLLASSKCPMDLSPTDVLALDALVQTYSGMVTAWLESNGGGHHQMMSMLRSYEVVVTWVGYCLVHQHCARAFPLVSEYATALSWKDLGCLVLPDKRAVDAAREVARYIRRVNTAAPLPLFSLAAIDGTIEFARRFGEINPAIQQRWVDESNAVKAEMDEYMDKVRAKQAQAAVLRAELPSLESAVLAARITKDEATQALAQAVIDFPEVRQYYSRRKFYIQKSDEVLAAECIATDASQRLQRAEQALEAKKAEIARVIVPPRYVVCPLPETADRARSVLFFFLAPTELNTLARLSAASQYTLVPRAPGLIVQDVKVAHPPTSWAQHYNAKMFQRRGCHKASLGHWFSFPLAIRIPSTWGPNNVDGITHAHPSFWFPTQFELGLHWSQQLNPFLVHRSHMRAFFTEQLKDRKLQWLMECPAPATAGDSARGNLSYANLHMMPREMSKTEYLTLGLLRAFPNQQVRKIVQALYASTLPWSHPLVLSVTCQAMFHIGELADTDAVDLEWKRDLERGWLDKWYAGLALQISLIRDTIRDYKAFVAAAKMASYLSQFYPQARELARELVAVATEWVAIIHEEMETDQLPPSHRLELRAKECLMYGYGILAQSSVVDLTAPDARNLVDFVVKFRYGVLFGTDSSMATDLAWMEVQVADAMASRVQGIVGSVLSTAECDDSLSHALRGVFIHLPPAPLHWTRVPESMCYETTATVNGKVEHYMINVLTGCVLLNGNPPSRLPRAVLDHATYKRYVDQHDFDVVATSDGVFRTTQSFDGANMELSLHNNSKYLCIQAVYCDRRLELVEFTPESWLSGLPTRLRTMHSHWVDRQNELLLFRPPAFKSRANQVVAMLGAPRRCYEVPSCYHDVDIADMLAMRHSFRRFVDASTIPSIASVLSKFESAEYVHAMLTPDDKLNVYLPRFGLTFEGYTSSPRSLDFREYCLATVQHCYELPPFFQRYLVLERIHDAPGQPTTLLLVPNGLVVARNRSVTVDVSSACNASLTYYTYEVAPHSNQLAATSIAARLQLAAIFAASSCSLPDPHVGMTGSEMALLLLRQCWTSRPYSELEAEKLANVAAFAQKEPALAILCDRYAKQSLDRAFLVHYDVAGDQRTESPNAFVCASMSELRALSSSRMPWNEHRRKLHPHEMMETFGPTLLPRLHDPPPGLHSIDVLPACPVPVESVALVEKVLLSLVSFTKSRVGHSFPFQDWKGNTIEQRIVADLKSSWKHFKALEQPSITNIQGLDNALRQIQLNVERNVTALERYLKDTVMQCVPARYANRMRLRLACNRLPNVTPHDILIWATSPNDVLHFNPYFSPSAINAFQQATHLYLATCVLHARLRRLLHLVQTNGSDALVVRELQVTRTWSIADHPRWLVFEVEGMLQIRPEQATIALHLLREGSGTICQLNMGLGKTRVILPMLILHYTALGQVPRVHILGPILRETIAFFHQHLCASTLGIRIVDQPFHRQVSLTSFGLTILGQRIENACYIVAPEHRLSLEMKYHEYTYVQDAKATELAALLAKKYVDIFDECDALLHHRYQLVYAMGTPTKLDQCETRAIVAQDLLDVLNTCRGPLKEWMEEHCLETTTTKSKCHYRGIRLKADVPEASLVTLRRLVLSAWLVHPSAHAWFGHWMQKGPTHKDTLMRCILDKSVDVEEFHVVKDTPQYAWLLALRGFLGFGILEHCLQQRPRVQFGVDPKRHPKRLAIPFRAADVPSARAEFGQPDVAILLTTIAYYYQGLSAAQVMEAVNVLLSMGLSARTNEFESWMGPIRDELEPKEAHMLQKCSKLDPTNGPQMTLLVDKLASSTHLINFWLRRCVFPKDMAQYPARIATSAWNLAHTARAKGFSGTNETNPILPVQIVPKEPPLPELLATNGLMLDSLMTHTVAVHALAKGDAWKVVVDFVLAGGYDAL